jgi:hypothetical protein
MYGGSEHRRQWPFSGQKSVENRKRAVFLEALQLAFARGRWSLLPRTSRAASGAKLDRVLGTLTTANQSFGEIRFFYEASPITGCLVHPEAVSPAEEKRSGSTTSLGGSIERGTSFTGAMGW